MDLGFEHVENRNQGWGAEKVVDVRAALAKKSIAHGVRAWRLDENEEEVAHSRGHRP
jgi:hypothetical protein